jgi:methyl-accepting chemotaxis protein
VRDLGQRSASAANVIKHMIATSAAIIGGGTQQASGVSATMAGIKDAIYRVPDSVGPIAAASDRQNLSIHQAGSTVTQMNETTQQNAALVEQSAAAAQSRDAPARTMKQTASVFRTGQSRKSALHGFAS